MILVFSASKSFKSINLLLNDYQICQNNPLKELFKNNATYSEALEQS